MLVDLDGDFRVQRRSPENTPQREACLRYRKTSRHRPPFEYEAKEPPYKAIDERAVFDMEDIVFHGKEYFPKPPDDNAVLENAYNSMVRAQKSLEANVDQIKVYDRFHREDSQITAPVIQSANFVTDIRAAIARIVPPILADILGIHSTPTQIHRDNYAEEKLLWEQHEKNKLHYLQLAMKYLLLTEERHPVERDKITAARQRREVYAIYIGHEGIVLARRRSSMESNETHSYAVCMHAMNRAIARIATLRGEARGGYTADEEEHLFYELYLDMLISIFHDTLKDSGIDAEDLRRKLPEMFNFDVRVVSQMRRSIEEGGDGYTGAIPNFAADNIDEIIQALVAVKKPRDPAARHSYIQEQILVPLPEPLRSRVFVTKVRSRTHNIATLRHVADDKQIRTIYDTLELIDLGIYLWTYNDTHDAQQHPDLLEELAELCLMCSEETKRVKDAQSIDEVSAATHEAATGEVSPADMMDIIGAMMTTNERILLERHGRIIGMMATGTT